jgi:acyl carrier protein
VSQVLCLPETEVMNLNFKEMNLDSLDKLDMVCRLEQIFPTVKFGNRKLPEFNTPTDIVNFINSAA